MSAMIASSRKHATTFDQEHSRSTHKSFLDSDDESGVSSASSASSNSSYDSVSSYESAAEESQASLDGELRESPIPVPNRNENTAPSMMKTKKKPPMPSPSRKSHANRMATPLNPMMSPINTIGYDNRPSEACKSLVVGQSPMSKRPPSPAFFNNSERMNDGSMHSSHSRSNYWNAPAGNGENESPRFPSTSASDVYQALVVGSPAASGQVLSSPSFQSVGSQNYAMGPRPMRQPMQWNVTHSPSFQSVGSTKQYIGNRQYHTNNMQAHMQLNSPSFQSVGSQFSRSVVYQAPPPDFEAKSRRPLYDSDDEEPTFELGNRAMYDGLPLASKGGRGPAKKENTKAATKKSSVFGTMACGTHGMEGEIAGLMNSVRDHFIIEEEDDEGGPEDEGEGAEGAEDDGMSLTRISADLRKQRLRNRVLQNERDNVSQENSGLRDTVSQKDLEIKELRKKLEALEGVEMKSASELVERDIKIATLMNEFLEAQEEPATASWFEFLRRYV